METAGVINQRIAALRERMKERGIDACLIPTADFHGSEYVNDYFKCREYITGFTGSAGTAVITADAAGLWTDGRYFVQAAGELSGSEVILYRMGEEGVPSVEDYLSEAIPDGGCLAFDGRVVSGHSPGKEAGGAEDPGFLRGGSCGRDLEGTSGTSGKSGLDSG